MRRASLAFLLISLVACSSKDESSGTPATTPDAGGDDALEALGPGPAATNVDLAPACGALGGGTLKYARKTSEWGLDGVFGNHLQAVDLDRDGYPDLVVLSGGSARSDPTQPPNKQFTRIFMNRPKPGGGRQFVDTTVESGFGAVREGATPADGKLRSTQLAVWGDVDGDGDLDAFAGTYVDPTKPENDSGDRNEILLNDGTGKFTLAPKSDVQTVPSDVLPPTSSATFVDVDRDGALDAYVGFWYKSYGSSLLGVQARLFKGNGDGTFVDATPGSGLETQTSGYDQGKNHRPAYGVTSCDLDDDGNPELLLSAYGRQWNLLHHNLGGLHFEEIGQASGFAGDANVDYSDNEFYRCYCQQTGKCTAPAPRVSCGTTLLWSTADARPWRNNGNTFTTACGDLNGDGKPDLYSAEIVHWHIGQSADPSELLVNDGPTDGAAIHFSRPGRANTGLEWPHPTSDWNEGGIMVANADLDLDGYDDLVIGASDYPGNYSMVFHQKPDAPGTFEEIGEAIGLHHSCTNGIAIADFDRDGDLDVVVGSSTMRDCAKDWPNGNEVHFYENQIDGKRGFLQVELAGKGKGFANATGIGARVKVVVGETGARRVLTKQLLGGYGHFGMEHDTALTFGLGDSCAPGAIEVRWPNGELTLARFTGVGGGRRIRIAESGEVTEIAR